MWLTKHIMVASTKEFPRLVITKYVPKPGKTAVVCFATHFYTDETSPPEEYVLTMDEQMACSLDKREEKVSVREMCRRFYEVLCASSSNRKLLRTGCE